MTRNYLGVDVFEGAYAYRGMRVVPSWGGSMFEALMPALFVPEARWGLRSWGVNHPLYVRAQIEHGLDEAGYGYWGFSPSDNPSGGTPHASFLALDYAPHAALDNLARLRSHFAVYGSGGFFDAVNVDSGQVAGFYLALDQAMAGAVNALTADRLQKLFAPTIESRVKPLLAMEQFGAG